MIEETLRVQEDRRAEGLGEIDRVIDADAQLQETLDAFLPYMRERSGAKRVMELTEFWRDMVYAGPSGYPLYEYKRANGGEDPVATDDVDDVIGADELADRAGEHGVDAGIVNPTLNLGLSEMNNDRFAVAIASAYNDWLLDQLDGHDDLVGNAVIARQAPERAAEEIDRLADEDDIAGIQLPATDLVPPPGHRQYEPIYEAAQDHGLPIAMKTTVGNKNFGKQYWWGQSYAEDHVYQHWFVQMRNVTSIMFEAIPERYPDLEFVLQGAGLGYVPYMTYRLDDHYLELGYEIPGLEKLPSDYLEESFYWCTQPIDQPGEDPTYLAAMVDMIGPENVMFASDLPHAVTDLPEPVFDRLQDYFDAEDLGAVFGDNAAEVYGL